MGLDGGFMVGWKKGDGEGVGEGKGFNVLYRSWTLKRRGGLGGGHTFVPSPPVEGALSGVVQNALQVLELLIQCRLLTLI